MTDEEMKLHADFDGKVLQATKVLQDAIVDEDMDLGLAEMAMLSGAACLLVLRCQSRVEVEKEVEIMVTKFRDHVQGYLELGNNNGIIAEVRGHA